ncbi:MAG: hypothetical protein WC568_09065 [Candidatus Methanoperedens sp.]
MEQMITPIEKTEFKHIIEFEINRLDVIIGSLQSNINQIRFAFIGSLFAVILALGVFIKNMSNLIDILITISFFIASMLFIYSNFSYVKALILPQVSAKPIVKNVPYNVVLKTNMEDRKTYLANFFEPILKINLSMQILFIISMVSPFIWQSLGLSVWDKWIQWISYFVFFDAIIILFLPYFYKEKAYTDFLFDRDSVMSDLKNIKSIKSINLCFVLVLFLFIIVYPYFWFILTSQYILLNINYLFVKFNELPFVYLIVLITTWFIIKLGDEYTNYKYHMQVLVLKQEKYRDIRRELYESNNPDVESLWSEFKLNAPW